MEWGAQQKHLGEMRELTTRLSEMSVLGTRSSDREQATRPRSKNGQQGQGARTGSKEGERQVGGVGPQEQTSMHSVIWAS